MRVFNSILGLALAVILVGNWGCSKSKTPKGSEQAQAEQARIAQARAEQARLEKARADFEKIMMTTDQLQQDGKTPEAISTLEGALANKALSEYKTPFFRRLLAVELAADTVSAAQARYKDMQRMDPGTAHQCLGLIEDHLFAQQQFAALGEWVASLMKDETDEGTVTALARWQFRAARAQGTANAAVLVLTPLKARLNPVIWRGLAGEFGSALIQGNVADDAGLLIAFLSSQEATDPEIGPLRISLQIGLWVAQKEWTAAAEFVKGLAPKTADNPFNGYFVQLAEPLRHSQQNEPLVALCKWALYDLKDKPVTRETAAQTYLRNAEDVEQVTLALDRITELKTAGFDALHVARWMDQFYSLSMKKGGPEDFKTLLALCEEALPKLTDAREQANVAGIILDVAFRLDRFEPALKVVENGVSGQDKAWHETMINKIKAHIDMQQGRPLEAAQRFIKYLNESVSKMDPAIDPITGELITREMVQGLNAKRIADLMKKGGNDKDAAVYYSKSREYYTQALKSIDPNSDRTQKIKAELASLPQ